MTVDSRRAPRVSVLLSAFDAAASLRRALDSIRDQHFQDWELIAIDDGSRDGTLDILNDFARTEPRTRVIVHQRNAGLAASLNEALGMARGALIARMDADDISLPDRLGVQVAFLDAHPEVDILGGGAILMTPEGADAGELRRPELHADLARRILLENPFIHPTVMARRATLIRLGGYDTVLRRGQDYDLWLRAYPTCRLHNLPRPLLRYCARREPRWRDAWYSSRIVLRALRREGRAWQAPWLAARPPVATAWARLLTRFQGSHREV